MWDFKNLRQLAIERLTSPPPQITDLKVATAVERVAHGIRFHIPAWICTGVTELVKRDKLTFTSEEKGLLGMATLQIFEIREEIREEWQKVVAEASCGTRGHGRMTRTSAMHELPWKVGGLRCNYCTETLNVQDSDSTEAIIWAAVQREFDVEHDSGV